MILHMDSEGFDQTAYPQSDQGLRCPPMTEDTFSLDATHFFLV